MDYAQQLAGDKAQIEVWLKECFAGRTARANLYDAMNYSLLSGGKRLRPILTMETCRMCGGDPSVALAYACAVEMVHTYSLIHDDLPCMDDDDLRRGRLTNHKVFGEATAVLAGDGLLTAAFETLSECRGTLSAERTLEAVVCLSKAAGARGMVGGQALDMAASAGTVSHVELEGLQRLKTGALITAAAELGCIVAGGGARERTAVRNYAQKLGLAFQVRDDMLDVEGSADALGKPLGSDASNEKMTFAGLLGLDACRAYVEGLTEQAVAALAPFEHSECLHWLAWSMAERIR